MPDRTIKLTIDADVWDLLMRHINFARLLADPGEGPVAHPWRTSP